MTVDLHRVTSRYWYVVNPTTESITFTIDTTEPDAQARAEHHLQLIGPGHQLELREFEYWVSPTHEISRQVMP